MLLTVAKITTLDEVLELAGAEATVGVAELEGPQEVGGLLEVGANIDDLVDEILHADDAVLAEVLLDDGVVGKSDALAVDLAVSALVDELLDALEVGVTISDPRLNNLDHLGGGLGDTDEDTVVDLEETEELEDLARLRGDLVDTVCMSAPASWERVGMAPYPLMRTRKISLCSAGMWNEPSCLARRLRRIFSRSTSRYSLTYFSARLKITPRFSLLACELS